MVAIPYFSDIHTIESISLPKPIFSRALNAIKSSNKEKKEQWITFGMGKQLRVVSRGKSKPFFIDDHEMGFISFTNPPQSGHACIFHTHPILTKSYISSRGYTSGSFLKKTGYPLSAYIHAYNSVMNIFTWGDIETFLDDCIEGKYKSISDLLGTSQGYSYMVWANDKKFRVRPSIAKQFEIQEQKLFCNFVSDLMTACSSDLFIRQYRRSMNNLLESFCKEHGILLFQNLNFQIPTLYRVA